MVNRSEVMKYDPSLGAIYRGNGLCQFRVWAPSAKKVEVHILTPNEQLIPLHQEKQGYHYGEAKVEPGSLYLYCLDGDKELPDPASRYQPKGVHGPSQVIDTTFDWSDQCWYGLAKKDLIFYELHVGTFTPEGTFDTIIPHLEHLKNLGITAIEIMPISQFPGNRNWGYDGVYPFCVQNSYGKPGDLQRFVNTCHKYGLAVFLDVVYNHLGPEGNYLREYGPYFTDRYKTPWGDALNYDGPNSDEVRRFFIENAIYWIKDFHIDGLRLDAIHAIMDRSAYPFLKELNTAVHKQAEELNRRVYVIAESDLNDPRVIQPHIIGGYGLDGQWNDDFHHSLHSLLTKERDGYYKDFETIDNLAKAFRKGYVYTGQYSKYRQRRHGYELNPYDTSQLVVYSQNHDQVGNRAHGNRLSQLITFEDLKIAASVVLLSPFIPLLFMGEEYGETSPFQYFTSHSDPKLVEAVRKGRREEFTEFSQEKEVPDPQDEKTFLRSILNHELINHGKHHTLYELYKKLIQLRKEFPSLIDPNIKNMEVITYKEQKVLLILREDEKEKICIIFSFNSNPLTLNLAIPEGNWEKQLDSSEENWLGPGSSVPKNLTSPGNIKLYLNPKTSLMFKQEREA